MFFPKGKLERRPQGEFKQLNEFPSLPRPFAGEWDLIFARIELDLIGSTGILRADPVVYGVDAKQSHCAVQIYKLKHSERGRGEERPTARRKRKGQE